MALAESHPQGPVFPPIPHQIMCPNVDQQTVAREMRQGHMIQNIGPQSPRAKLGTSEQICSCLSLSKVC